MKLEALLRMVVPQKLSIGIKNDPKMTHGAGDLNE
jgi:hypothetical protein